MPEKPSESAEKPASEPEKTEPVKPIAPMPRQAAASGDRAPAPASPPPDAGALNQQLMSALAQALTGQAATVLPPAKDDRGLISREEKRFRRAGGPGRSDAPGEGKIETPGAKAVEPAEEISKSPGPTPSPPTSPIAPPTQSPTQSPTPPSVESTLPASESSVAVKPDVPSPETGDQTGRRTRIPRDTTPTALRPKAPTLRTIWRQMPGWQKTAIFCLLGALLAFLGFVVGRNTAPEVVKAPTAGRATPATTSAASATPVTKTRLAEPAEIKLIDEAMQAQTKGDFATAEKLLQELTRQAPDIAGNQTALALLSIQKGDLVGADVFIKKGIDAGEDAGRLYGLRGMIEARLSHPRKAAEAFEMATRAEPHQFKGYFLWAEFLRRLGKNQQALERFDQAIARVHEQADEDLMQFKRRLTLIAVGRGSELEPEIQKQLAINPPAGEWLLLAMANAGQKYDFKSAAKYLERASQTMNQDDLVDRLRDFYLYQWCYEKELEPYFQPLQKRLSAVRRTEPVATEAKPGEDEPSAPEPFNSPAPTKR